MKLLFLLLPFLPGCYAIEQAHQPPMPDYRYEWMIMQIQERNIVQPPSGLEEKCDLEF